MSDKVGYWLNLCDDDLKTAWVLYNAKQFLWMCFICHLITEKALKAAVVFKTNNMPPKIHRLTKLAEISGLYEMLSENHIELLEKLTPMQIESRYPEYKDKINEKLTTSFCKQLICETEEFLCWIKQMLKK